MKGVKKRISLFLLVLFSPELAKSKMGYRTVAANGFIRGISPLEWALILVSSAVFGIAHYIGGGGWEMERLHGGFGRFRICDYVRQLWSLRRYTSALVLQLLFHGPRYGEHDVRRYVHGIRNLVEFTNIIGREDCACVLSASFRPEARRLSCVKSGWISHENDVTCSTILYGKTIQLRIVQGPVLPPSPLRLETSSLGPQCIFQQVTPHGNSRKLKRRGNLFLGSPRRDGTIMLRGQFSINGSRKGHLGSRRAREENHSSSILRRQPPQELGT